MEKVNSQLKFTNSTSNSSASSEKIGGNLTDNSADISTVTSKSTSIISLSLQNQSQPQRSFKSAFFNFLREFKQKHPYKDYHHIMRIGARQWHSMRQIDRAPYILEAARTRVNNKCVIKRSRRKKVIIEKDRSVGKHISRKTTCPECRQREESCSSTSSNNSRYSIASKFRSRSLLRKTSS